MQSDVQISDKDGKTLMKVRGGRVLVARYPNMSQQMKDTVIEFYTEFTGEAPERIKEFLDFENEEFEFCS